MEGHPPRPDAYVASAEGAWLSQIRSRKEDIVDRRKFLSASAVTAAGAGIAAPQVARAQDSFNWRMTNAYGPTSPFYTVGPGSPTDMIEKIRVMSGGRLNIQHYAAGELIPALEGFDAVQRA